MNLVNAPLNFSLIITTEKSELVEGVNFYLFTFSIEYDMSALRRCMIQNVLIGYTCAVPAEEIDCKEFESFSFLATVGDE